MESDQNALSKYSQPNESSDDRRRESRFLCNGEAHIIDTTSGMELGQGIITDISPSGASLYVYCPLVAGAVIELRQGESVYRGEIRYCVPAGPDFRLGIQLIPPEQWSPAKDWPLVQQTSED